MINYTTFVSARQGRAISGLALWMRSYLRRAAIYDFIVALVSSMIALEVRFGGHVTSEYAVFTLMFPLLWILVLWFSGAYDNRYIGIGSDEFRKVLNAGVSLTAALAIVSYAVNTELSRAYLLLIMPSVTILTLNTRYRMRKRLHRQRALGRCMATVLAVGPGPAMPNLINELRRDSHHGLTVVATCLTGAWDTRVVAGVPVVGTG